MQRVGWGTGLRAGLIAVAVLSMVTAAHSQNEREINAKVNYVYATQFGFGGYSIGGLDVTVYSLPLRFKFDDVLMDWDLRVGLPIIYGHYDLSGEVEDIRVNGETNSLAVEPRLWLDIPIFEGFRISPGAAWGFGTSFGGNVRVRQGSLSVKENLETGAFYTYQIGLATLYQRPWDEWTFSVGAAFVYAGDADISNEQLPEGYGTFRTGVDARHPLGFRLWDLEPDASAFFIYNYFTPSLSFTRVGRESLEVPQIFELGATVGSATPLVLPVIGDLLDGSRIGVAYGVGEDFDAIHVVFGFPF